MRKKKLARTLSKETLAKLSKSIWLFPLLCFIAVLLLTTFKISGSSVGMYYKNLYGPGAEDPNLLFGRPRSIRSDEWEWQTAMTAAQAKADYPVTNQNIGDGQQMGIIVDVPYKHWSVIFKPQNLAFFILPFAYAFAFKWWLLAFLLVVSAYFFILTLLPKKKFLAAVLSLCLLFSPFIQWWYQTITLAPIFYSFFIAIAAMKLWQAEDRKTQAMWALTLSYVVVCFAIIVYPPFQIPCILAMTVFLMGYFLEKGYLKDKKLLVRGLRLSFISLAVSGLLIFAFIKDNHTAIAATKDSVYPGKRIGTSGHFDPVFFFTNFLDSQLQLTRKAKNYVANQSEASNFILLSPFLTLPALYTVFWKRKKKRIDWPLLVTTTLFVALLIRLFVPGTDAFFNLLFLGSIPNARLLIGIGLISFLQLILFIRHMDKHEIKYPKLFAWGFSILAFVFNLLFALAVRDEHPGYINSIPLIVGLATVPAVVVLCILSRKTYLGLGLLLLFSLASTGLVHPIYRGTGPIIESSLTRQIEEVGKADRKAKWAVADNLTLENVPAMSNVPSITGIYSYPQNDLWGKSSQIAQQKDVYNRFAHTLVRFEPRPVYLNLIQPDFFEITGSPCSSFYQEQGVKYLLTEEDYTRDYSCLKVNRIIHYPNTRYYILEIM